MENTKIKIEENSEELVYKPRKVLKKRIIFVESDDELIDIYEKLERVKAKMVYFVIPQKALIFQSLINLKILKKKANEMGKKIYFITNDINGINLAKQLKIKIFDKVNNDNSPSLFSSKADDDFLNITPLKASVNAIIDHTPTRLSERKLSISEILNRGKKLNLGDKETSRPNTKLIQKKKEKNPYKIKISTPNKGPLVAFLSISGVIAFAIFYIALPSATIILTPSASVLEKSVNITLLDNSKNRKELESFPINSIASFPISTEINREIKYTSTGKKISEKGGNARGSLFIVNESSSNWPLVAKTRFQTNEGIVFRIKEGVNVPANGRIKVSVEADAVDAFGLVVGDRGNIGPTRFFLPGLSEENRAKVYAESEETMIGGITDFVTFVSDSDIDGAKAKLEAVLKKDVIEDIQEKVKEISKEASKSIEYVLLTGDNSLNISKIDFQIGSNISGSELLEFSISGKISASGIYYDRNAMLEILKAELITQKSPQKELLRINEKTTSYRIFERDNGIGKIRLTANIKGIEQFDISLESQTGRRILEKIRTHIAGKDIEYTTNYIQNLPEVNKVEIKSWPAWAPTIPKIEENIKFEVRQAVIVN
jgi:hypothetical protein